MNQTFPATMRAGHLEWQGTPPPLPADRTVRVEVTILDEMDEKSARDRGQRMVNFLKLLCESDPFRSIEDPVAWQRDVRQDRTLLGRDE